VTNQSGIDAHGVPDAQRLRERGLQLVALRIGHAMCINARLIGHQPDATTAHQLQAVGQQDFDSGLDRCRSRGTSFPGLGPGQLNARLQTPRTPSSPCDFTVLVSLCLC